MFVNRFFFPDHSATSQHLADVAFFLASRGHEISVITSRQRYDSPAARLDALEQVRGVAVIRVWTSRFGRCNLFGRALDYFSFYVSSTWALWTSLRRGDVVVAKTDPPLISVLVTMVARMRGAKSVNWVQDMFPEVAAALGVGFAKGLPGGVLLALRDASLRRAEVNVAIGHEMAHRIEKRGIPVARIRVISNWADDAAIAPLPRSKNSLRECWNLRDRLIIGYSGNMGRAHSLAAILEAAERLRDEKSVVFLLIGDGAGRAALEDRVMASGLVNIMFKPYQPREELRFSLTLADAHLVSLRPELEGLIVPSKAYGILAAGRPMIYLGAADGEIGRLVIEGGCGLAVPENDGGALASAILALKDDPERMREMGSRARALLDDRFSQASALAAWERVLVEVADGRLRGGESHGDQDRAAS